MTINNFVTDENLPDTAIEIVSILMDMKHKLVDGGYVNIKYISKKIGTDAYPYIKVLDSIGIISIDEKKSISMSYNNGGFISSPHKTKCHICKENKPFFVFNEYMPCNIKACPDCYCEILDKSVNKFSMITVNYDKIRELTAR